ncbi:hypothetical protein EB796_005317 [Bugula neritina]|uniref:Uncharacterized protein n=1 Tax=Bugula neritina TaxID=10212 RepID=A0A7J7KCJ3_BUGNE|nr:hypothetical protein EB796_005317 [Bugula neritina]
MISFYDSVYSVYISLYISLTHSLCIYLTHCLCISLTVSGFISYSLSILNECLLAPKSTPTPALLPQLIHPPTPALLPQLIHHSRRRDI